LKQLHRKLKKDPNSYEANLHLGVFYFERGDIATSVSYLEKASAVRGDQAELLFILANAYKSLDDRTKSEKYFEGALSLEPDNFEYLYNYGLLLHGAQRIDEAAQVLERAVKLKPDNYELINDVAVLYYLQRNHGKAINFLKQAIEINPGYIPGLINLGYVYLATQDFSNAQKTVDQLNLTHCENQEVIELHRQLEAAVNKTTEESIDVETELTFSDQLFQITPFKIIKDFGEKKTLQKIGLSIVIPILNEKENIALLHGELSSVLKNLKESYEVVFINDGSTDGSGEALEELAGKDENVRVIQFRRNYGQTASMNAGFKYARGGVEHSIINGQQQ